VEDQSAPIPEEIPSELGRIICASFDGHSETTSVYKETGKIEYADDTALAHRAVMDENESPVEVQLTKN
jgi:hypothetical protein